MKKKFISILLVLAMVFALAACTSSNEPAPAEPSGEGETEPAEEGTVYKVGMVCIGDDNAAYDRNFYMAADAAKEQLAAKGIDIEWVYTYNHPAGDPVAVDCEELADAGCVAVFCNSYGQEDAMLTVAGDYPDTVFAGLTNEGSMRDSLDNTVNAFPNIFEGRYLEGVIAGCKLQQMVDEGEIAPEEAVIGYVGAYTFAEVISGYTSFYLGAKSVCPSATMKVEFIGSWGDPTMEANTAQDLIDKGCVLISQHSDSTTPATTAQSNGVYHVGYNISMIDVAPDASLSFNGGTVDPDYTGHGLKDGDVALCELNEAIAAPGTEETVQAAKAAIEAGELHVFDTSKFTVGGQEATSALVDMTGDFVGDEGYDAIFDGYYHESYFKSAPAFDLRIDGIELLNEAY